MHVVYGLILGFLSEEMAFAKLHQKVCIPQFFKNLLNVAKVFFCCSAEDNDVIQLGDGEGEIL